MTKNYSFVLDSKGKKLAPCNENKAWILIRKKKAKLLQKYPMCIQLNYEVDIKEETEIVCGIDDGSKSVLGIKHRDIVEYTYKNGETYKGYVTALYPALNALNFQSKTKHCKKVNAKKCKLLYKFNKIYWF